MFTIRLTRHLYDRYNDAFKEGLTCRDGYTYILHTVHFIKILYTLHSIQNCIQNYDRYNDAFKEGLACEDGGNEATITNGVPTLNQSSDQS